MHPIQKAALSLGIAPRAVIGFFALLAAGAILIGSYSGFISGFFSGGKDEVTVMFSDSRTLRVDDPVRVRGIRVGEVKSLEAVDGSRATKAVLAVDDTAGTIHGNARAHVVWRSLLGGAFAVNLDPGTPEGGTLGSRAIPEDQTTTQVELDEVTSVVSGNAREGLRVLPGELARTMRNPGTLRALSTTLADRSPGLQRGLNAARGQIESTDLATLIRETGRTADALDSPTDDLRAVVSGAASLVSTTAARQAEIRDLLRRSPGVMRRTNVTLSRLDDTLDLAQPLVESLRAPADDVAPALRRLRPVAVEAAALLRRAEPLLDRLRPAVRSLAAASRDGLPLLDSLQPSFDRLDDTILPYMNEIDPETAHSAAQMVGPAVGGLGNVAAQYDANGHFLRFPATSGSSPLYLPCQVVAGNPDFAGQLTKCKSTQQLLETYLSYDPLAPAPGTSEPPPSSRRKK
jgi:phospholipid/cholesterol/gamma-HCH transport system substrate-binding protein